MHVEATALDAAQATKVPWLGKAKLALSAEEQRQHDAEADAAAQEYRQQKEAFDQRQAEDAKEAAEHTLTGSVGIQGTGRRQVLQDNHAPDVTWVKKRLVRLGYYEGEIDASVEADFVTAISNFQAKHVAAYRRGGVGYILVNGLTLKALQKTRAELGLDEPPVHPEQGPAAASGVDAALAGELRRRGKWEMTKIVTGLDVEVKAGEPIWTSGYGPGPEGGATAPLVHWELFSEQPLFGVWPKIEDGNDDLTMDACEQLMAAVDDGEGVEGDGMLTKDEVVSFYASDGALSTRSLQCRFRGEWAADPALVGAALTKLEIECVGEVEEVFGPYSFWTDVGAALPTSPHVWHYHPVSLLKEYARVAGATTGDLRVDVFVNQQRHADIRVELYQGNGFARPPQATATHQSVLFRGLSPGDYKLVASTEDVIIDEEAVVVSEGITEYVRIGKPPKVDVIDLRNPFRDYQPMRLTRCREGEKEITLSPHCPAAGDSGVTLGYGFDMGGREPDAVRATLSTIGLAEEWIDSLIPGVGKKGAAAQQWFSANRPFLMWKITDAQRFSLLQFIYPHYQESAMKRATSFEPKLTSGQYDALHERIRELLTDLTFVGAHYSPKNSTGRQVNTILANTALDQAGKLRALRDFVGAMPSGLQPPAGRKWREQYIDASLEEVERRP